MRLASKVISFLFHPMLMATIGMYLILNIGPLSSILGADGKRLIYLIVFFSTAVLPVSLLPLFYQFGVIKSFQMESSRERVVPVMMTAFFYFLGYLLLKRLGVTGLIAGFMQATVPAVRAPARRPDRADACSRRPLPPGPGGGRPLGASG